MGRTSSLVALGLLLCGADASASDGQDRIAQQTDVAIRAAIERPRIPGSWISKPQFDLSRDGKLLAYLVQTADIATNSISVDLWVANTDRLSGARRVARVFGGAATVNPTGGQIPRLSNPAFSPDGKSVALVGFGEQAALAVIDVASGASRLLTGGLNTKFVDIAWSPDGETLAVQFNQPDKRVLRRGIDVDADWNGSSLSTAIGRIALIDVESDQAAVITPETLDVTGAAGSFSWSPDGSKLAFSGHHSGADDYAFLNDDLFVLDVSAKRVDSLVSRPGADLDPRWSPDGRFIAFQTAVGSDDFNAGWSLAIYDTRRGSTRVLEKSAETAKTPYSIQWINSRQIAFVAMRRMSCPLFLVRVDTLALTQLSPDDLSCMSGARYGGGFLYSVSHNLIHPAQLVRSSLLEWNPEAIGPPTAASVEARQRVVQWNSAGGEFTVHGILIEPGGQERRERSPLLVSLAGGPGMVTPEVYNDDAEHLIYPALLRGYSILVPNTRGRGGYDDEFAAAMRKNDDYLPGPLTDVLSGIDYLAQTHHIDQDQVALVGFSYGAILSQYAATRTSRFRVIMALEGAVDLYSRSLENYGSIAQLNGQAIMGFSDPFDPTERQLLLEQSPLQRASSVSSPVLLECGNDSLASECLKFFRAVKRRSSAPIDLVVYPRTGHGISEPALRYDSALRQAAWLDRWLPRQAP